MAKKETVVETQQPTEAPTEAPKVMTHVPMVRESDGAVADVHINEIANYTAGGWVPK